MKHYPTMADKIRANMIRTDDDAEEFGNRAEARTWEAWNDPEMLADAAGRCAEDSGKEPRAAALLVGKILQASIAYATAWRKPASADNDAARVAALTHILACATQLDGNTAFEAKLRAMVEDKMLWEWEAAQEDEP